MVFQKLLKSALTAGRCYTKFSRHINTAIHKAMELSEVVSRLKEYAPLSLAEPWDNVGLLVEPARGEHLVQKIMLTNDLTEAVIYEAIKKDTNMIISYHPPIFAPFKRLTRQMWKERVILEAIENKIAIYSPHTAFDAVSGGVNDWLASGLGEGTVVPLKPTLSDIKYEAKRVSVLVSPDLESKIDQLTKKMKQVKNVVKIETDRQPHAGIYLNVSCHANALSDVIGVLTDECPELLSTMNVTELSKIPIQTTGVGRLCTLDEETRVDILISRIKEHLQLKSVRFAPAYGRHCIDVDEVYPVKTIALCAGSGGSVLKGVKADMYFTGEMSHHDVLDAVANEIHVVLCEHSNTERGFLAGKFQFELYEMLERKVEILISENDCDSIGIA